MSANICLELQPSHSFSTSNTEHKQGFPLLCCGEEQVKDKEDEINICLYKYEAAMINDTNKVFVINSVSDFYGKYK